MHIGVDATCWQNNRGYGRHARALLSALVQLDVGNRYTFYLDSVENSDSLPPQAEARWVSTSAPTVRAASSNGHRSIGDMWQMSHALSDASLDLLFFPTVYSYVPVISRAKKIIMIHDIIADKFPHLTFPSRTGRLFWNAKSALGRWQADAIATVSDFSRDELVRHFGLAKERVFVVAEASDSVFRRLEHPQLTPYLRVLGIDDAARTVIYVGGFGPHKNLEGLVAVFARIAAKDDLSDVRLVMVGEHDRETFHSYFGTIRQQVAELGLGNRVIFTGYLPDDELRVLLNQGTVLVLPSLMEGFGLPAVEAAACGCPVIATTASPLPELLGEGGIYFEPTKLGDLEGALTRVLASSALREQMRHAGLAAAQKLTWDAAARQLMDLIEQVGAR